MIYNTPDLNNVEYTFVPKGPLNSPKEGLFLDKLSFGHLLLALGDIYQLIPIIMIEMMGCRQKFDQRFSRGFFTILTLKCPKFWD